MNSSRLEQLLQMELASPKEPFILFAIAKEYEKFDNKDQALSYYQKLSSEHPSYVGTYYHLGKLLEKLEEAAQAFAVYKQGMAEAQKQGDQHSYAELAGAKLNLGDDDDFEL